MYRQRRILSALTVQLGRAYQFRGGYAPPNFNRPPSLYRHTLVYQRPLPTRTNVHRQNLILLTSYIEINIIIILSDCYNSDCLSNEHG